MSRNLEALEIVNLKEYGDDLILSNLIDMSWSRLDTYNMCPAKYKYRYCEKLEERATAPLALGKAVHEALENVVKFNTTEDIEAVGFYLTAVENNIYDDVDISTDEIEEGRNIVLSVKNRIAIATDNDFTNIISVEDGFKYILGRGIWTGFIDLIFWDEDERGKFINVVDYKFSSFIFIRRLSR